MQLAFGLKQAKKMGENCGSKIEWNLDILIVGI
jgi:hypothetical protein